MSSLSVTDICNLALDSVKARATISSINERSPVAQACARHYAQALAGVLQSAHWNFARKQAAMTLLLDATKTPPDNVQQPWLYEYAYPSDCVQARYVMPLMQGNPGGASGAQSVPNWIGPPVRFIISSDTDASGNDIKVILCNQQSAILVYTKLVTSTALMDDQFVVALSHYLGYRVCNSVSGDNQMRQEAYKVAMDMVIAARASNGNEGLTVIDHTPDWIRVRGYASDWAYPPGSFFTIPPQSLAQIT